MKNDSYFMELALAEARLAFAEKEVPVGCVIVKDDQVIAKGHNTKEQSQISTHHAEIIAINQACKILKTWRLDGCEIYVSLEPCSMCAGAILQSRISRVIYGASDYKGGALGSNFNLYSISGFNHYPDITRGVLEKECSTILTFFFKQKRKNLI